MSLNYFTHATNVTANGDTIDEIKQVGYSINDNPVTEKLGGKYNKCATSGDRSREFNVTSFNLIDLWAAFATEGYDTCEFDLEGEKCTDGTTDSATFSLGTGTGSTFGFSVDDTNLVEAEASFALVGDPA